MNSENEKFDSSEEYVVYVYDIEANDIKEFNKIKRRFYYNLNKIKSYVNLYFITKSTMLIKKENEKIIDEFFKDFCKKGQIRLCKIYCSSIITNVH